MSVNVGTKLRIVGGSNDGPSDARKVDIITPTPLYKLTLIVSGPSTLNVGQTTGFLCQFGKINSAGQYETAPSMLSASDIAWETSDAINTTISSSGVLSATKGCVTTISGSYTYEGVTYHTVNPKDITFNDVHRYEFTVKCPYNHIEVGGEIQVNAYFEHYMNEELIEQTLVNDVCTWTTDQTYVTVNKGLVKSPYSCQKMGVGNFIVTAKYVKNGKTYTGTQNVSFDPHEKTIFFHWNYFKLGTYLIEAKIVADEAVPCDVKIQHTGGPSYAGFDGIYVYNGTTTSSTYTYNSANPPSLGGCTPTQQYYSSSDTKYWFRTSSKTNHDSYVKITFYKELEFGMVNLLPLGTTYRIDKGIYTFVFSDCQLKMQGNQIYDVYDGVTKNVEDVIDYIVVKRGSETKRLYPTTANSVGVRNFWNFHFELFNCTVIDYGNYAAWDSGFRSSNADNIAFGAIPDNEEWIVTSVVFKSPYSFDDITIVNTEYEKYYVG